MEQTEFAIFDVDTRQARAAGGWTYMPRVLPYREHLDRLMDAARKRRVPTLITTCVGGNMLPRQQFESLNPDTLFIPIDPNDAGWSLRHKAYDVFYLEKKPRQPGFQNHEIFLNNKNAESFLRLVNINRWIVFGNAMETCSNLVISKLREFGCIVQYIPELMIPGIACKNCDPESFKSDVFTSWGKTEVTAIPLERMYELLEISMADRSPV